MRAQRFIDFHICWFLKKAWFCQPTLILANGILLVHRWCPLLLLRDSGHSAYGAPRWKSWRPLLLMKDLIRFPHFQLINIIMILLNHLIYIFHRDPVPRHTLSLNIDCCLADHVWLKSSRGHLLTFIFDWNNPCIAFTFRNVCLQVVIIQIIRAAYIFRPSDIVKWLLLEESVLTFHKFVFDVLKWQFFSFLLEAELSLMHYDTAVFLFLLLAKVPLVGLTGAQPVE